MRQVIFCRTQLGGVRWKVRECICAFVTLMDIGAPCPGWSAVAGDPLRRSGSDTRLFPVPHDQKSGSFRRVGPPFSNANPRYYAPYLHRRGIVFRCLVMPLLHRVTLALHARNAKKNFTGKILHASVAFPFFACNVGKKPAKFPENPAVSDAVDSSSDCMMLNRNRTTDFPDWLTFARILARFTTRGQDAQLPPAADGGTP
ncbi:hypothetical protein P3T23_001017 [Paraburkholderia sp. GAS448]|uniref:hypothetical protein n=1 Tax=Paraburkholderia sp. GAS448 TaxID=3035136 RepID=UPI003D1EDD9A